MIVVQPTKIVCIGRNYRAHVKEMGDEMPTEPVIFFKPLSALLAPGDPIVLPRISSHVECEAEIGVVVGRRLRNVTPAEAEQGIRGFTCLNDVTARDLQRTDAQWARAKGFDTFCPVGPRVVGGLDWRTLEVIGRLNGQERQRGRTTEMAFSIPDLLAYISRMMTLEAGDVVATGTPAGTAKLSPGDTIEVEIPGVGILSNPVIAES